MKRRHRGLARAFVLATLVVTARPAGSQSPPEEGEFRVAMRVDLVEVHATVLDRQGRTVSGLRREHFKIYEDGVLQTIRLFVHEEAPVAVGLVVDHSASAGKKTAEVLAAARAFLQASRPQDQMFVVNFNEHVTWGLPASMSFTSGIYALEAAISNTPSDGMTALYDAIASAHAHLQTAAINRKVLLVISDGGDNASARTLAEVSAMARQSSSLIYAIGIFDSEDPDRNPGVLRRLARSTGGEAYFPAEVSEVAAAAERIARDIRNLYTLGYIASGAAKPGAFRSIRVSAAVPEMGRLSVRARTGYIAAPAILTDAK